MKLRRFRRCCFAAALAISGPSCVLFAQQTTPVASAPLQRETCVLHVWPSQEARSSYVGWFHGGAVDGDRRGIKGYPPMHAQALTTDVQQQLLKGLDWAHLLARPGLSVVIHDAPPAAQDDQARTVALVPERPDCYDELIVHSVLVERAPFSAPTVRVMVIAKSWHGRDTAPKTYTVMADDRISLGGQSTDLVDTSLKDGFVASVVKVLKSTFFQQH